MTRSRSSFPTGADYRRVLLADVNDLLDEDGRPIGEIRASEAVRRTVRSAYVLCPYAGSRSRTPRLMNSSALDQVTSNWPTVLGLLNYVRTGCITESSRPPPLIDLARTAAAALTVPAYLIYSEPCRLRSRSIPAAVAAAHKMCAGLFGLCKNRLLFQIAQGSRYEEATDSVASLFRYAEESGALLSRTGMEACAGPPHLMAEALGLLAVGNCQSKLDTRMAERLIGCREVFLNYAYAVIDLTLWLNVFVISCHDNVGNVQYQLEEVSGVCDPEFVNRARAAAIDFRLKGCSDPTLSGLFQFSEAVRTQYAIGAASLLRNPDPLRVRAMLGHESCGVSGEGVDKFKRSFIASMQSQMPDEISRVLAEAVFRALVLECEGVHIFFDLQSKLHEALNWTPPSLADAPAVLASVFGVLPSEYVTTVFGSGPLSEFKQTRGQGQSL